MLVEDDQLGSAQASKYRLDAEAKGSTVFRIPEDVYKTRGRQPEGFMTSEGILNTVDPIG